MTSNHDELKPLFDPPRNGFSYGIGSGADFRPYTYGELTDEYEEKLKLLDEKTETIRSQDEKIKKLEHQLKKSSHQLRMRKDRTAGEDEAIRTANKILRETSDTKEVG